MYKEEHFGDALKIYADAFSSPPLNYCFITPAKAERYLRSIINTPGFLGYTFHSGDILLKEKKCSLTSSPSVVPLQYMFAFVFGILDDYFDGVLYSISEFAVMPDMQRKGVGSEVLKVLETKLAGHGVDAVNLNTSTHLPAYGFYKKNGYVEVTENVSFMKWLGAKSPEDE